MISFLFATALVLVAHGAELLFPVTFHDSLGLLIEIPPHHFSAINLSRSHNITLRVAFTRVNLMLVVDDLGRNTPNQDRILLSEGPCRLAASSPTAQTVIGTEAYMIMANCSSVRYLEPYNLTSQFFFSEKLTVDIDTKAHLTGAQTQLLLQNAIPVVDRCTLCVDTMDELFHEVSPKITGFLGWGVGLLGSGGLQEIESWSCLLPAGQRVLANRSVPLAGQGTGSAFFTASGTRRETKSTVMGLLGKEKKMFFLAVPFPTEFVSSSMLSPSAAALLRNISWVPLTTIPSAAVSFFAQKIYVCGVDVSATYSLSPESLMMQNRGGVVTFALRFVPTEKCLVVPVEVFDAIVLWANLSCSTNNLHKHDGAHCFWSSSEPNATLPELTFVFAVGSITVFSSTASSKTPAVDDSASQLVAVSFPFSALVDPTTDSICMRGSGSFRTQPVPDAIDEEPSLPPIIVFGTTVLAALEGVVINPTTSQIGFVNAPVYDVAELPNASFTQSLCATRKIECLRPQDEVYLPQQNLCVNIRCPRIYFQHYDMATNTCRTAEGFVAFVVSLLAVISIGEGVWLFWSRELDRQVQKKLL